MQSAWRRCGGLWRPTGGEAIAMTTTQTKNRPLADTEVFPIGLGGMPLALDGRPDEAQGIRTIQAALDAGVTLIDTADAYCRGEDEVGHNERLIAKALKGRRDGVIVATKAGHIRPGGAWELDGRPEHIRAACEASLKALDTDRIDLYQFHRPDPNVPYAESVGAFKELQDEGKVRWVGLSNCTVEQLEESLEIVEIVSVQNQLSLGFTSPLAKGELDACTQRGIAFLPWSPLGGIGKSDSTGTVEAVRTAAETHDVSPQQVALAWLLAQGPTVIPIPGASRPESITDSARAAELELSDDEVAAITRAARS
jgi:aryl-alcohol dehydrogenase-like predicted oxidoreductase